MLKEIVPFGKFAEETEYVINGVRYIVSSKFKQNETSFEFKNSIKDRTKKYLGSDFSELNYDDECDKINSVNTTAGKEDYAV